MLVRVLHLILEGTRHWTRQVAPSLQRPHLIRLSHHHSRLSTSLHRRETVKMTRGAHSKLPMRHKSNRNTSSPHVGRSGRASGSVASRQSGSTKSTGSSRPRGSRKEATVSDKTSTRAHSESVTRDGGTSDFHVDDTLTEVVMAVDLTTRGTVGCCYYVAREEKLFFMEDIHFADVDVVDALRVFINPTIILVSTKIDDTVIDRFDPEARSNRSASGETDQFRLPFLLEVRPPNEFAYTAAKSKLVSLRLGEDFGPRISFNVPGELIGNDRFNDGNAAGEQGKLLRLAGWVDMESHTTVRSALLTC